MLFRSPCWQRHTFGWQHRFSDLQAHFPGYGLIAAPVHFVHTRIDGGGHFIVVLAAQMAHDHTVVTPDRFGHCCQFVACGADQSYLEGGWWGFVGLFEMWLFSYVGGRMEMMSLSKRYATEARTSRPEEPNDKDADRRRH